MTLKEFGELILALGAMVFFVLFIVVGFYVMRECDKKGGVFIPDSMACVERAK